MIEPRATTATGRETIAPTRVPPTNRNPADSRTLQNRPAGSHADRAVRNTSTVGDSPIDASCSDA